MRRLGRLTVLATPLRAMSAGDGALRDSCLVRGGVEDFGLGDEGMLSSPEESPPASASSSASRSAMVRQKPQCLQLHSGAACVERQLRGDTQGGLA